ncbi:hypothetical protein CBR_g32698 [Chara braunii]|uniref:PXA domain-containing protein n=1 Tax=Chara braunii TaxID=69332 RepID=A0A388LHB5_CHABU|nr:hypothetical protein CBR_g32698 [Chara braunii]|eukprot:GBG81706.1 hypothetical protein CBR_g32698 [Chara braunii]
MRRRVRIALEDDGGSKPAKLAECVGERTGEIVPEEEQSSPMGEEGSGSAVEGGGEELKPAGCIARDSHGRGRRAASASARSWGARSAVAGGKSLGAICRTAASASVRTLAAGDRRKVAITGMAGRGAHKGPQAQKGPQTKSEPLGLGGMSHISNISLWIPVSVRDGRIWEKARKVLWPIIFGPGRSSHDLLEEAKHRAAVVLFLIVVLAYLMSLTSESVLVNIPIAALMLAGMRRLYLEVDFNWRWRPSLMNRGQESVQGFQSASPVWQPLVTPASASTPSEHSFLHHSPSMPPRSETVGVDGVWRQAINAPAVEAAIDDLMRAVLDEFVTNLWYRSFTPDQDATEELRLLLNTAIGEIAKRVKKVNLISLLARDFAREIVTHIGGEVKQLRDNVGKFCEGAIQGAKAAAAVEGEGRPRKDPVKLKFPDVYGGKKNENFDNWEASVNSYIYLQHILIEEQVPVAFQALKDEAASFARSLARTVGCENNLVAYSKVTPLSQFLKLLKERFADPTRGIRASDKLQKIHSRQWRSAKALKGTMDDLVAVPDHGVTEPKLVQLFYRAIPEALGGHVFDKSQQAWLDLRCIE